MMQASGPLILGAGGRLGQSWQRLWQAGHWPDSAAPLWQMRRPPGPELEGPDLADGALVWDLLDQRPPDDPRLDRARGVVVLAGVTAGPPEALARNAALAEAAIRLSVERGLGPVLLCSSGAVYGRATGPQAEAGPPHPANPYGAAKLAMEDAVAGTANVTALRLSNVAGCDMLFSAAAAGAVRLDRFANGTAPRRAYIGPLTLARVVLRLIGLAGAGVPLPPVLNVAAPGTVGMDEVLQAAGLSWTWTPAPDSALPELALDTGLLQGLAPVEAAAGTAAVLVAEAALAGWRPAP